MSLSNFITPGLFPRCTEASNLYSTALIRLGQPISVYKCDHPKPFMTKQPTINSNNCQENVSIFFFFFRFFTFVLNVYFMDFSAVYCKCIVVLQLCTVQYWTVKSKRHKALHAADA